MAVSHKICHTGAGGQAIRNEKGTGSAGEKRGLFISLINGGG